MGRRNGNGDGTNPNTFSVLASASDFVIGIRRYVCIAVK